MKTDEDEKDYELANEELDTKNMPDLDSEESAAQKANQRGQGLKTLTPQQILTNFFSSIIAQLAQFTSLV